MNIQFLGSSAAFRVVENNFQSNVLIRLEGSRRCLMVDCGSDARLACAYHQIDLTSITDIYISHLHSDHIGGLEWFAFSSKYSPQYQGKPHLYLSDDLVTPLWENSLSGGLSYLTDEVGSLETFFNVHSVSEPDKSFTWEGLHITLVKVEHIVNQVGSMPCYGLFIDTGSKKVFFTADTTFNDSLIPWYEQADVIFQDCEVGLVPTGVHAHYQDLKTLPADIKAKMWLYHYADHRLLDIDGDGFLGYVSAGQEFNI